MAQDSLAHSPSPCRGCAPHTYHNMPLLRHRKALPAADVMSSACVWHACACVSGGHDCASCHAVPAHAVCNHDHDGAPLWVQDCNLVVYDGYLAKLGAAAYDAIYQTGTANAGTYICSWLHL